MKKITTKSEQSYINSLLKKRKEKEINQLLSRKTDRDTLRQYEEDNHICKDGKTCLERQIDKYQNLKK